MKMYWPEFVADTMHLNTEEVGAYCLLIAAYWQHGGLPTDDLELASIARVSPARWRNLSKKLAKFFMANWRHKRIDKELELADELHEKRSRAAVIGNTKRSHMRSFCERPATHIKRRYITTSEYDAEKAANRESKHAELKPSAELDALERKRRP